MGYIWRRECAWHYPQHVYRQLYQRLQLVFPKEGTRWRLRTSVDRFPLFIARPGLGGTLVEVSEDLISLKLDELLPGTQGWKNCLRWMPDDTNGAMLWGFPQVCEPITK